MKALVYTGPNAIDFATSRARRPVDDVVVVKVDAVGICGSDMHAYHGHDARRPAPLILGHEAAGRSSSGPRAGERVTINPLGRLSGPVRSCRAARPHLSPTRQLVSMPPWPGASPNMCACPTAISSRCRTIEHACMRRLAEPIAVSWHAVNQGARLLARPLVGLAMRRARRRSDRPRGRARARDALGAARPPIGEPNALRRATAARIRPFHLLTRPGDANEPAECSADLVIDAVGAARDARRRIANCRAWRVIVHVGLLPGHDGSTSGSSPCRRSSSPAPIATRRPIFARRSRRSPRAGSAIFLARGAAAFRGARASPTSTPTRLRQRRSCCGRSRRGWRSDFSASRRRNSRARPCSVNDRSRKARPRVYCR